jgi:hypothetical protein
MAMFTLQSALRKALVKSRASAATPAGIGRRSLALGAILVLGSTLSVLATANTPPTITSLSVNSPIVNEGDTVTITGTFTDPDASDAHNVLVFWENEPKQKLEVPVGSTTFQLTHKVTDDSSSNHVVVEVRDRQLPPHANDNTEGVARDGDSVQLQVKNVAPTFSHNLSVVKSRSQPGNVTIKGDVVDPGADTVEVFANWGQGFPQIGLGQACTMTSKRSFECEHTYPVPLIGQSKTYTVKLTVRDDDGDQSVITKAITIP